MFSLPLFEGKVYVMSDLGRQHLPMRQFYRQCLLTGESFAWWPQILCGHYLHGEGLVGIYHPLHLLLYRFLPLDMAFDVELLINYPVMWLGMVLFLRRWRVTWAAAGTLWTCTSLVLHNSARNDCRS